MRNEIIFQKLRNSARPIIDNDANLQTHIEGMYIYAFFLAENSNLKDFGVSGQLLYLGITERGLKQREFMEHLKSGRTGKSSFRRSIGAILKEDLNLKAIPRTAKADKKYSTNYKFDEYGEKRLTDWIKSNCTFGYYELSFHEPNHEYDRDALETIEDYLSINYGPTLNLSKGTRKYNKNADALDNLRKVCRREVERSYS